MNQDDKISSALGIRPLAETREDEEHLPVEVEETTEALPPAVLGDTAQENLDDLEKVRANIEDVMENGKDAMKEMLEIAKQSEHPRAFEVVSTLMKTVLDANKDYADISSKKRFVKDEINGPKEAAQTSVTNNNLIVSTADLLKMIKGEPEDG